MRWTIGGCCGGQGGIGMIDSSVQKAMDRERPE